MIKKCLLFILGFLTFLIIEYLHCNNKLNLRFKHYYLYINSLNFFYKNLLIITIAFIFLTFLNFFIYNINIIYLDDVVVHTKVGDVQVSVKGNYLKFLLENFGDSMVFAFSARLAAAVVAKSNIHAVSKIGISLATAGTGLTTYKIIQRELPNVNIANIPEDTVSATVTLQNINLEVSGNYQIPTHPYLDLMFGKTRPLHIDKNQFSVSKLEGDTIITGKDNLNTSHLIAEIKNLKPN